jgi:hypothetical protein
MMDNSLETLTSRVAGKHIRTPFTNRVFDSAVFVTQHPEHLTDVGILLSTTGGMIVNLTLFSDFLGIKRDSLGHNFRDHHFTLDRLYDPSAELLALLPKSGRIDTCHWSLRRAAASTPANPTTTNVSSADNDSWLDHIDEDDADNWSEE